MSKIRLYIKQIFLLAIGNKLRFCLTFIGMFTGLLIFSLGNLVLESYYYGRLKEIRETPENAAFVLTEGVGNNMSEKLHSDNIYPEIIRISNCSYTIYEKYDADGNSKIVYAYINGVTKAEGATLIDSGTGIKMVPVNVIYGRNLSDSEINNNDKVCLIDEYTANLLFGESDVIGREICFNQYTGGVVVMGGEEQEIVSYEVVGVIEDTYYSKGRCVTQNMGYNYSIGKESVYEYIYVNIICPYEYYKNIDEREEQIRNIGYLWECDTKDKKNELIAKEKSVIDRLRYEMEISNIIDKENLKIALEQELEPIRYAINIVTAVLMIISGVAYMSILFFSLKERISEIGIRKAFGASSLDIVFQFFLENMIITILAVVSAVLISILIGAGTSEFMQNNLLRDYELDVSLEIIMKPILFGLIQCIVFTVIPSVRFSLMKVANALRQE
ncbi:MAG: ABC transporter permease [Lachnospiraceae bacterium]|nr:ABC transporter permease [Lachnospiraceae bacterium]